MLKERLRGKRIRFTDAERALLARKAKAVGRKALLELETRRGGRGACIETLPDPGSRHEVLGAIPKALARESGIEVIRLPPMSPDLNSYAERFVRSIKQECLEKMIFVGQASVASLRRAINEFTTHYHTERNHQGLGDTLIRPQPERTTNDDPVHRCPRLGGMLNYYYRARA